LRGEKEMRGREEKKENEREGETWAGQGLGARGEPGRVEERSSIRASLLSLAEEHFLGELGTAQVI
jgi:hypothetical protein